MRFEPADNVVFPGIGVGVIAAVESLPVDGATDEAYRIEFNGHQGRLWVPVDHAGANGLRPLMSERVAERAFEVAASQKAPKKRAHWNRRRKRYDEWLSSPEPTDLAKLVGELSHVKGIKKGPLSFGERRLLEKGWDLLVSEMSAALGLARALVERRLHKRLGTQLIA